MFCMDLGGTHPGTPDGKTLNFKTYDFLQSIKTEKQVIDFRILGKIILKNE